ncbi:GNS1/SUR4 membrane protein [Jaminaea rosea]|uniref:Elongation of fatty acids protein n=1 Tax=Jaminaea rosea TaxID=1569628 RepID=A0A316UXH8_9BASI|nr:GNS1/SUR4 membrane protein [Jaminaea rosea]PWN30010.1 GNS1/SUR4 membrane protein [Jaminaea rosea]
MLSWQPGRTPFSTFTGVAFTMAMYLTVVLGGRELMRKYRIAPMELRKPFVLHNVALSLGSALLLACMLEEILPIWYHHGFFAAICAESSWTPRMETLYIFNYMFKFWELADTGFLVLKKKPLAFLHVYHHSATALLCFSQLIGRTSVSWVVICLNLFVHVVMYAYYALSSLKIRCPWKRAVTTLQILQFILDLAVVYFASYCHTVAAYSLPLPVMGSCAAGKEHAVASGCTILSSYLVLFVIFYRKTYNRKPSRAKVTVSPASGSPAARSPVREKDQSEVLTSSYKRVTRAGGLSAPSDAEKRPNTPQLEEAGKR